MKIAILGAGGWGLAIGKILFENGNDVHFWMRSPKQAETLTLSREDSVKLPNIKMPDGVLFSSNIQDVLQGAELIVLAVPSKGLRGICELAKPWVSSQTHVVSLAKGIEVDSLLRMSQIIQDVFALSSEFVSVLSGPSHAEEVALGIPTSVVVASHRGQTACAMQKLFMSDSFRVYTSDDIVGVELCGALKNVIAIATGILDGLAFGDNTKGALMSRGLAEISRLGEVLGGHIRTFPGLAGMGDLITTCMSQHSRNRHVGEQIGRGKKLQEVLDSMSLVAEGVTSTLSAYQLAKEYNVEMPIVESVYEILYLDKDPREAAIELMKRDAKAEGF